MGKRWTAALALAAALGAGYWWLALDGRLPDAAHYDFDLAEVRRLADSLPGDKPAAVQVEKVAAFSFPEAMVMAGGAWRGLEIPVYAYRLVYADRTVMVDSALDRSLAKPAFMVPFFDDAAYARVEKALEQAALIVVTHEHMDHLGGLARHPQLAALLPATRLTAAQLAEPKYAKAAGLPDGALAGYAPLRYERYAALAPGVVLVAAPGHTPGSQMVYVRRADGRELLFIGDVAWQMRNIEAQRERPRWVTGGLIDEDRVAVAGELKALDALRRAAPELHLVPGHDGEAVAALVAAGLLQPGFQE
ncbi:MBL fold metallo-hydrolase [Solimonas flava]|jgi:glyoxylase-like metal-dependent hydrolase (beta-lactamase superfamily II)|uniref:MBL fold metallo-hydrolase n=1 Tax=Solimonas flava TaxID=415849 RepID=UPI00040D5E4B|nr:MBL fold metallo-hydrolase [Solimonas flava]